MFDDNSPPQQEKDYKKMATKYLIPGLGIVALLSLVFSGSLYIAKYHPNVLGLSSDNSQTASPEDVEKLVKKVSELILLPSGETPNIATVNDLTQVRSQDFFKNAEVGDKVLIYSLAKKAYLYRPSTHKLIEVGIVNQDDPNAATGGVQNPPEVIIPTPLPTIDPLLEIPVDEPTTAEPETVQTSPTPLPNI